MWLGDGWTGGEVDVSPLRDRHLHMRFVCALHPDSGTNTLSLIRSRRTPNSLPLSHTIHFTSISKVDTPLTKPVWT